MTAVSVIEFSDSVPSRGSINSNSDEEGDMARPLPSDQVPILGGSFISTSSFERGRYDSRTSWASHGSFIASAQHAFISSLTSVRHLVKSVGLLQGFMLIVGILIGSGVFVSPSLLLASVDCDVGLSLSLWLGCGLIALGGALCYCELGCAIKKAGGNHAYIHAAYGELPAFLCAWTIVFIVDPAGVTAITLTFGTYIMMPFQDMIDPQPWHPKALAAACILMIALINCWSVRVATRAQTIFTLSQILAVVFVVAVGFWKLGSGHTSNFEHLFVNTTFSWSRIGSFGAALYNGLWAYDGWSLVSNVTEEMTNVDRNLFLSIITGIPFVIACYVAVNVSFLSALSTKEITSSPAVGVLFIKKALGTKVAYLMPVLVALSCYGAANGTVFACGRLSLAAGREGHLPEVLSMIHRTRNTPIPAILLTSLLALLMLIPDASGLETLISFFNFACWFIYGLSIFAVVVLRIRQPHLPRPYKVFLLTPIVMTVISVSLVLLPFFHKPLHAAFACGLIALGLPMYFLFILLKPKHPKWLVQTRSYLTRTVKKVFNLAPCRLR